MEPSISANKYKCTIEFAEGVYTTIDDPIGFEVIEDREFSIWSDFEDTFIEASRDNGRVIVTSRAGRVVITRFVVNISRVDWLNLLQKVRDSGLEEMSGDAWRRLFVEPEQPAPIPRPRGDEPEGGKRTRKTKRRKTLRRK